MRALRSIPSRLRRIPDRLSWVLALLAACAGAAACAAGALWLDPPALGIAARGLAYSRASASVIQPQPPAGSCRARGSGLYALPDPRCTPGALNPAVTPATIGSTICARGWTSTVRPAVSVTEPEKLASIRSYGLHVRASSLEYDHLVPLELGGAVNDPRNLWPEPDFGTRAGFYLNPKDHLERALNRLVCSGRMSLSRAQLLVARDWVSAYRAYG